MTNRRATLRGRPPKDAPQRRITNGARELRAYLDRIGMNVPDWSEKHGFGRVRIQRLLTGERWQRISVDFAFAIERATQGNVRWSDFLSETAKAVRRRDAA